MTDENQTKNSEFRTPEQKFFGRRKGNKLSHRKRGLVEDLLPTISVDPTLYADHSLDPKSLFDHEPSEAWFEVGFELLLHNIDTD